VTTAAVVFCCVVALALAEGFGAPAFRRVVASDAFSSAMPLLVLWIVARFALRRFPQKAVLIQRVHAGAQGLVVTATLGWQWVEPHAMLTSLDAGSLATMAWLGAIGAVAGLVFSLVAERATAVTVARELLLGAWTFFLAGGGRLYRSFDHVEAGTRVAAATAIGVGTVAMACALWMLLRRRERVASGFPALAPAMALLALMFVSGRGGPAEPAARDSILLVVVDTLRADIADGRFRGHPAAMPELQRIAADGVRFTQALSPAPWTLPATVSLLSGWNPHRHRFGVSASGWEVLRGDPAAMYLAGALRDAGYLTAAFVNNPYLRPWFGFSQGFYQLRPYHGHAIDGVALALNWLQQHLGAPSFCLLHLMDPHWPYEAPPGFGQPRQQCEVCDSLFLAQFGTTTTGQRDEVASRYAAEVHYSDTVLGKLYDSLVAAGALEHSWLVITSDHGEELWDHGGFLHGHSLFDELLRVPLVIVPPRAASDARRGVRVDAQVRLEDVSATMLEVAGLAVAKARDGKSLLGLIAGKPELLARVSIGGFVKSPVDLRWSVRRPPWKIVASSSTLADNRLFDLLRDSAEQRSMLFDPRLPAETAAKASNWFFSLRGEPSRLGIDVERTPVAGSQKQPEADTQRRMKSLGYLQ